MSRRALSLALRLAVSLGLLMLLALVIAEPAALVARVAAMSGISLIGAIAITVADRALMAYKWRLLLLARGVNMPLSTAVRAYFASSFAGLFLPVTLGADAVRILASRRFGTADITASIVVERTLGAVSVVAVALAGATLIARRVADLGMTSVIVAICLIGASIAVAFPLSLWLTARWARRDDGSSPTVVRKVAAAYGAYASHPAALLVFVLLSVFESLMPAFIAYVVARGLHIDAPLWLFVAAVPISLMVARLPVSLGGFGVQEASFVYLAGLLGLGASDGVATMLVMDAVLVITLLPAAFDVSILSHGRHAARTD